VLAPEERRQILETWNDTAHPAPMATRLDLFEEGTLTYFALNARANRLAHRLVAEGVGPETIVALCLSRSLDMVASLLAILKAGAA
jgi:non-ribosomal peptide synthetase component F